MSIQTELTRLTNAKNAIVSAIEGKGVDVPSGAKLDALAALVEAIQAGGGGSLELPSNITEFAVDKFTLASSEQDTWVGHSLGVVPNIAIIFYAGSYDTVTNSPRYMLPMAIVFGPAMAALRLGATTPFDGTIQYGNFYLSSSKRNTLLAMTDTRFYVSMASADDLKAGDYVVITAKW